MLANKCSPLVKSYERPCLRIEFVTRNRPYPIAIILLALALPVTTASEPAVGQSIPRLAGDFEELWVTENEFAWTEGPAYDGVGGVWFVDSGQVFKQPRDPFRVLRYDIASGATETVTGLGADPGATGLAFDDEGRLVTAHGPVGMLTRRSIDQLDQFQTIADNFQGTPIAPNDLVLDHDGGIFFTHYVFPPTPGEDAIFYISPSGDLQKVGAGPVTSNGIGLSPDGKTLYVASSLGGNIMAYDVGADHSLINERVFAGIPGLPDGITVDRFGNVYSSDLGFTTGLPTPPLTGLPNSMVRVFNPAGDEILSFKPPQGAVNLAFGAPQDTLYIAGWNSLHRVPIAYGSESVSTNIVSPNESVDSEGPGSVVGGNPTRIQFRYPAEDFESLPASLRTISSVAFRPDGDRVSAGPVTGSLKIRLSTVGSDEVNTTFSENLGADETVVFDGTVTWQPTDEGSRPSSFDYVVNFQAPFEYDPSRGDLLLDFLAPESWSRGNDWHVDTWITDTESTVVGSPSGSTASFRTRQVWPASFTFIARPWLGDANLDGEFNSGDLIAVFQAGEYEDGIATNSMWAEGDWNGDHEFDSGDLVAAFQDGGFEQGPRPAMSSVPEPTSWVMLVTSVFGVAIRRRQE